MQSNRATETQFSRASPWPWHQDMPRCQREMSDHERLKHKHDVSWRCNLMQNNVNKLLKISTYPLNVCHTWFSTSTHISFNISHLSPTFSFFKYWSLTLSFNLTTTQLSSSLCTVNLLLQGALKNMLQRHTFTPQIYELTTQPITTTQWQRVGNWHTQVVAERHKTKWPTMCRVRQNTLMTQTYDRPVANIHSKKTL